MNEIYEFCKKNYKQFSEMQFRIGKIVIQFFKTSCLISTGDKHFGKDDFLYSLGLEQFKKTMEVYLR